MSDSDFSQQVAAAAQSMPVIEQAKGLLLGCRRYSAQQAFDELAWASQQHNVKLASLARALVNVAAGNDHLVDDALWEVIAAHWTWLLVSGPTAAAPPAVTHPERRPVPNAVTLSGAKAAV